MKFLIALLISVAPLLAADEVKPAIFKVSEAGKNKIALTEVFRAVQDQEMRLAVGAPTTFRVIQVLGPKRFLVRALDANNSRSLLLVTKEDHNVADDEVIRNIHARITEKTHAYESVSGAKTTVRIAEEITPPPPMSQEAFVNLLKAGETWTLKEFKTEKCKECFGDGKLSALQKFAECGECSGKGEWKVDLLVTW